jgi:hypothetical protein
MRHWLILCLLASTPAYATGFTSGDLAAAAQRYAQPSDQASEVRARLAATEELRIGLALTPEATLSRLSGGERDILTSALGPMDARRTFQTAWLMAGLTLRPTASSGSRVALYHPLTQSWAILGWERIDGTLRLSSFALLQAGDGTQWLKADSPYLISLTRTNSVASLDQTKSLEGKAFFDSIEPWIKSLANWVLDPSKAHISGEILTAIREGQVSKLRRTGAIIATLPREVRATFTPIACLDAEDGQRVFLGSALYPNILVAADVEARRRPRLRSVTLINLANTQNISAIGEAQ